jgi:cytochrome bd-type quinol oxidase subunit 1
MENITSGHWVFAGVFVVAFVTAMAFAYRKDLTRLKPHYKKIWLLFIAMIIIYFIIFGLNRIT